MKTYRVIRIKPEELVISGNSDSELWSKANLLTDFSSPWDEGSPLRTEFRALWDGSHLFFSFMVFDNVVHLDQSRKGNDSINNSDRVELFFRQNDAMSPYYCLEMDSSCRVMDFKANPNKQFDFNWDWPQNGLKLKSFLAKDRYTVEGSISIASLHSLNLIKDQIIQTGIYRAKYQKGEGSNYEPKWICWVNPDTETPNFHISSSFGELHLG